MGNFEEINCCQNNHLINDSELNSNKNEYRRQKIILNNLNLDFNSTIESTSTSDLPKNIITMKSIILIQSHIRKFISLKKLNEKIEVYQNIIYLDQPLNLIKNPNKIIEINKGEKLSKQLILEKKIIPYKETEYYKKNIKKYPLSKFLLYTPLIYLDKYKNDDTYTGTWNLERKFFGYGILYSQLNKFEGFWNLGKLNGEINFFLSNGNYFIGNFINGKANGKGEYYYNNGSYYIGNFVNDKKEGFGTFFWDKDIYYEGYWKNDFQNGKGRYYNKGDLKIGLWNNGLFINETFDNHNINNEIMQNLNVNKNNNEDDKLSENSDFNYNLFGKDENMFNLKYLDNLNCDDENIPEI